MLRERKQRQRAVLAAIVALATLAATWFASVGALDNSLQSAFYDYVITSAPAEVRNQIAVIALDDKTVERYGRWPVPRQAYADLLTALKPYGTRAVAFDVGFYDPSDKPESDRALAAAIKDSGNVILAMQGTGLPEYYGRAQHFEGLQLPLDMFREGAAGLGAVNVNPEFDSRVREVQLVVKGPDGKPYYALALVAAARHLSGDLAAARVEGDRLILPAKPLERDMPLNQGGAMRVYYAAPPHPLVVPGAAGPCTAKDAFYIVSMLDVIDGKIPRACLANRTIFVGAHSLSGVPDSYPVPNSAEQKMWGVEIWANAAQSIFTNRYPVPNQGTLSIALQTLFLAIVGVVAITRLRLLGFLAGLLFLAAFSFVQLALFVIGTQQPIGNGPVAVPSVGYLAPVIFWWVMTLGYLLVEEQLAVARTQSTFGRFVTPSIAKEIMDHEEKGQLRLGGETRQLTVLFGDIRGFTTMSEGMDPATLLATLNRYFGGMVEIVNRYLGTVNKYNGDNIMVIWNAPVEVPDHARKAVECALEIQRWVVAERSKGGPDVSFGFGINSGSAIAGFLGAYGRMEYTVIGDTVNVASRLTSSDIARRDQVAVGSETLALLGDDVTSIDLGAVFVKGRAEPVRCYQVDRIGAIANPAPAPAPEVPIGKAAVAGFH